MDVAAEARQAGFKADNSRWMDNAVRVGLVSYGVVHLLVAWLALELALGKRSSGASNQGAFKELASSSIGEVSLWVVGVGFIALVVWQFMEALWGHRDADGGKRVFKRVGSAAKVVIYASLAFSALRTATGGSSGNGGTDGITSTVMKLPAGSFLVGIIGVVVVGVAGYLAHCGWTEKFRRKLSGTGQTGRDGSAYVVFGKVGYIAKGVALAVVGLMFVYAAVTHDPKKSGGLDVALHKLLQQPLGSPILVLVALGLACYGLFCFAWATHLDR